MNSFIGIKRSTTTIVRSNNISEIMYTLNISSEYFMNKGLEMKVVAVKMT